MQWITVIFGIYVNDVLPIYLACRGIEEPYSVIWVKWPLLVCAVLVFISNGAILLLFISLCLHHRGFYKVFRYSAFQLNTPDRNRNDEEHLRQMIHFHVSVKKWESFHLNQCGILYNDSSNFSWFLDSAKLLSPYVMIHTVVSILSIASAIFQMDLVIIVDHSRFFIDIV